MVSPMETPANSQQLLTPELVVQVLRASQDFVITPQEFSEIMGTITNIAAGIMIAGILGILFRMPALMLQTHSRAGGKLTEEERRELLGKRYQGTICSLRGL